MFKQTTSKSLVATLTITMVSSMLACFAFSTPVKALQTVPYKMNFQGRIADSAGNALANGSYNMKFRIYDALTGGALQWSEQRANSASTGVTVTNGLFSVQLGDVTSLPPSIFTNQNLYFEIELPTPGTATCSTASCESYIEGPMGPRNKLGTSAYAFNSDTLDGIDSSGFIQNTTTAQQGNIAIQSAAAGNIGIAIKAAGSQSGDLLQIQNSSGAMMSGVDRFGRIMFGTTAAIQGAGISMQTTDVNQQGMVIRGLAGQSVDLFDVQASTGANLFSVAGDGTVQIQNAAGVALFKADTANLQVVVGTTTNGIVFTSNGITYAGTARATNQITLAAEYPGAAFTGDNSNNNGTLSSDFCSGSSRLNINPMINGTPSTNPCAATNTYNYYQWTTSQATAQDYDIYARYQIPSDYDTGSMANLAITGWGTTTGSEQVTIALYSDASGTACSTSANAVTSAATWVQTSVASPLGACTIAAGDTVTFKVHLQAGQGNYARSGPITFTYKKKF